MSLDRKIGHEFRQAISKSTPGQAAGLIALSSLPPALRPLVRAYVTGYATTVGPRLLALIVSHISRKRRKSSKQSKTEETPSLIHPLLHVITTGFEPQRFPTFCAVVAGGSTLLLAEELTGYLTDPFIFVVSCAFIMWSWFYYPNNLPRSYQKWITSAAMLDMRLIEALRRCKFNELRYGEDTGQASLLGPMCAGLDMPAVWGDPAKTIPYPCEVVHMKRGQSCEAHAISRLARSWKWAMYTYLPLALAFKVRKLEKKQLLKAFISASRSSLFLGSFITIFYYTICLARTRIGPYINGRSTEACQRMDGGICVGLGCGLCGWSILIETASRRKDMALFVAPRALATILPRKYSSEKQYKETLAFAASAAVISTCVLENPKRVRGVFGRLLNSIMRT
ncbi:unnamed protein product [Clonostachys chloroleuca]|uniref:Integral membrane protein n=1 Tax=Clonostachys chloroleuca TaxID=1926264 RepID=A0AA35V8W0_9HYPO|nr:unnamed protein product [Clonostachys chloroleuca]